MNTIANRVNAKEDTFLKELFDTFKSIGFSEEEAYIKIEDIKNQCKNIN